MIWIHNEKEILQGLAKIPGAKACHAEAAFGYSFELKDGTILEIGQSDTDISDEHLFWIKHYKK